MPGPFKIIATAYEPAIGSKGAGGTGWSDITGPLSGFFNTTTPLVCGTDYYMSDNRLSAFIAYPSEVANSITYLDFTGVQGSYTRPVNWVNFSLLSGLQVINASFTQGARLSAINLFAHPNLQRITCNEHAFTEIDVRNCKNFVEAFVRINRNPGLRVLDFAGVSALNSLSIETCQFSAFDVYGGPEYTTPQLVVYARDNPYVEKDFARCNMQMLTGIKDFYFSRFHPIFSGSTYRTKDWNFSALSGLQILNLDDNLFTTIAPQLMPARDTLRTFICSQNTLTSVAFNSQSQLNYLDASFNSSELLSSIDITPLPRLTYLNCNFVYGLSNISGLQANTWNQPIPESRVFQIDFANPASYPGSGNIVYNLRDLPNYADLDNSSGFYPILNYGGGIHVLSADNFVINYPTDTWFELGLNNNFTINMWLRLSSYPAESLRALFSSEDYQLSGFRCFLAGNTNASPGTISFGNGESLLAADFPSFAVQPATKIPLNTPVNLTFTVTPSGGPLGVVASVYINGKIAASASGNFRPPGFQKIRLFNIGGWKPAECDLFLVEYATGAQASWQIANRYNEYAERFQATPLVDLDTLLVSNTQLSALDLTRFSYLSSIDFTGLTNLRILNLPDPCKLRTFSLSDSLVTTLNLSSLNNVLTIPIINNASLSSINLTGLSGLRSFTTETNNISTLNITGLSGLTALRINEPTLTSLTKDSAYSNLNNVQLLNNRLPTTTFNGNVNLRTFSITNNFSPAFQINNNDNLQTITISNDSAIQHQLIHNNYSFNRFTYSGSTPVLSGLEFTSCPNLSNVSLTNAALTSDNFLSTLPKINNLSLTTCNNLSNIFYTSNSPSISTLSIRNCSTINNIDNINCPAMRFTTISQLPISSVDSFINNNNLQRVVVTSNPQLCSFRANLKSKNINYLDLRTNSLKSDSIDYALINLYEKSPDTAGTKRLFYTNNIHGRSIFSNTAYDSLLNRGWIITPAQPTATLQFTPTPTLTITTAPSALQYKQTGILLATATYLTSSIQTFFNVVSGPGIMLNSYLLSALSSNGTITVSVSSLSSNLFQPATATFDIALQKLDLSSNIVFSGLNKIYTGNIRTASATVVDYSSIVPTVTYSQNNSAITTPIQPGFYSVSASILDQDDYTGTNVAVLSVLNADNFYTLPASATSSVIYFPRTVNAEKDIVITFDYAFYGTESLGFEGFCISFADLNTIGALITGGGPGKALNYTNLTLLSTLNNDTFILKDYEGKFGGSLGIGFDVSGNFALSSLNVPGFGTSVPNSICIRDSRANSNNVLYRSASLATTSYKVPCSLYETTTGVPTFKTVKVRLTNLGRKVLVSIKPVSAYEFVDYVDYDLPVAQPPVVSVALSYSSGKNTPTFKIKNFNLNCFFKEISAQQYDAIFTGPGIFGTNGITFTTPFNYKFYYNTKSITDLPITMNLYINSNPIANILFDPTYINTLFAVTDSSRTYYSYFVSGANYLL
jgi:hypothetical protein